MKRAARSPADASGRRVGIYIKNDPRALARAEELVKEGGCDVVKLEGGEAFADHVHRIVRASIPVVGHVGLTPQSVHALGGFRAVEENDAFRPWASRRARRSSSPGAWTWSKAGRIPAQRTQPAEGRPAAQA